MSGEASGGCRQARLALGAYVLGALDPADRARVNAHLEACPGCREEVASLAGLPGLLSRLDESQATALTDPEPPDDRALARLLEAAAAERRRARRRGRRRALAAGVAVAVVAAGAAVASAQVAGRDAPARPAGPVQPAVIATGQAGAVSARVELTSRAWGTSVHLVLAGVPAGQRCRLVAVSGAGDTDVAASWQATYTGAAEVDGGTAVPVADLSALRVVTPDGTVLVTVPRVSTPDAPTRPAGASTAHPAGADRPGAAPAVGVSAGQ